MNCDLIVNGRTHKCESSHCDLCPRSITFDKKKSDRLVAECKADELEEENDEEEMRE